MMIRLVWIADSAFSVNSSSNQLLYASTETIRTIKDGEPRTATSTFTQLLSSDSVSFKVASVMSTDRTGTETTRTVRDREPRTPPQSTFAQPGTPELWTDSVLSWTYTTSVAA